MARPDGTCGKVDSEPEFPRQWRRAIDELGRGGRAAKHLGADPDVQTAAPGEHGDRDGVGRWGLTPGLAVGRQPDDEQVPVALGCVVRTLFTHFDQYRD